jgi:hypothetical protein
MRGGGFFSAVNKQTGEQGWWRGTHLASGKRGLFPSDYTAPVDEPTDTAA